MATTFPALLKQLSAQFDALAQRPTPENAYHLQMWLESWGADLCKGLVTHVETVTYGVAAPQVIVPAPSIAEVKTDTKRFSIDNTRRLAETLVNLYNAVERKDGRSTANLIGQDMLVDPLYYRNLLPAPGYGISEEDLAGFRQQEGELYNALLPYIGQVLGLTIEDTKVSISDYDTLHRILRDEATLAVLGQLLRSATYLKPALAENLLRTLRDFVSKSASLSHDPEVRRFFTHYMDPNYPHLGEYIQREAPGPIGLPAPTSAGAVRAAPGLPTPGAPRAETVPPTVSLTAPPTAPIPLPS